MAKSQPNGRSRTTRFLLALSAFALLVGLGALAYINVAHTWLSTSRPSTTETPTTGPQVEQGSEPTGRIVVAISVDGLNPDAFDALSPSRIPHFTTVLTKGATTLNARSAATSTKTLPNHVGMVTGREVHGAKGHTVTRNTDNGSALGSDAGHYIPSVFDISHDNGLATALYAEKEKFAYLVRSWNAENGAPDITGDDDGTNKIDRTAIGDSDSIVGLTHERILKQDTDFVFLHLAGADSAGHEHGWLGAEYLAALIEIDSHVGSLLAAAAQSERPVTFLITSDHGGQAGRKGHRSKGTLANTRVPFLAFGDGVGLGEDLYELNPGRIDPFDLPVVEGRQQPIRNLDLANTSLGLLGLPYLPGPVTTASQRINLR